MITFFNKIGNSWIAKIICGALGISMMAFWGLGGLSSSFSGSDHKAITVGSEVITIDQINQQLNQERGKISTLTGQDISVKKAIELGFLDRIIQQLIYEKTSTYMTNKIGLIASDASVRKYVERNPLFQDNLGNFDTNLFYAYMGQLKMNQNQLSEKLKQELTQQHLLNALSKSAPQNSQIIDSIASQQKEKREVFGALITAKSIDVGTPNDTTLKDYYEAYQEEFMNPEYRQIQLLSILPADFKGEKEAAYDKMYKTAQDLEDLLGEGMPLKEASQKLNLTQPKTLTIDISGKSENATQNIQLKDNPILQEIFTLAEGESTSLTDYQGGFLIAEVKKIVPVSLKPFDKAKDQVKALWKNEQQKEKLPELIQKTTEQVKTTETWGAYFPIYEIVEQTKSKRIPLELLPSIYAQKTGSQNAQSYPVQDGAWIIVVDRVIHSKQEPSIAEKEDARKLYTQDLYSAVQQAYTKDLNVQVNETTIKKAFLSDKDEE